MEEKRRNRVSERELKKKKNGKEKYNPNSRFGHCANCK